AAARPDRGTDRAVTGPAGALLAPRLLATATDLGPRLGGVRAATDRGHPRHHHLVHERHVHRGIEQLRRELTGAGLLPGLVAEIDRRHQAPPIPWKPWRFMVPAKPFPRDTPTTSAWSPAWKTSARSSCPGV